uniref:Nudix hydrolase domain-containing protein n=1 Tax=Kalanchoe fedtschenkoi TaxID=63787 RepID=A0A7N0UD97_KALFE
MIRNARPFVCGSFRSLRSMSGSDKVNLASPAVKQAEEAEVEGDVLDGELDDYDGVIINITKQMDSGDFVKALRTSMARWKLQGKKGVWIKLPIEHVNLVEAAVKEGFWYHHAEPKYLMLVHWIPDTPDTLPANASHRIGVAAFVTNDKKEVLVVLENSGKFKGTGVWKFPTGVVDEGEDIFDAAQREVKEETGIEAEFIEVLAFRQSHQVFFGKSDIFFVCMLRPISHNIQIQESEIEAAKWMPFHEFAAQPFVMKHDLLSNIVKVCSAKINQGYAGFTPVSRASASSDQKHFLYVNGRDFNKL